MTNKATKSTNVTSMVSTEESPEFKRRRMKEVRTMVARAVKNGKRVDLMGFEGTDIARSQIALQDLLSKAQERHQKATNHLAAANEMGNVFAAIFTHAAHDMMERQQTIGELSTALYNERMSHMQTAQQLQEMFSCKRDAEDTVAAMKRTFEVMNG